MIAAKPYGDLAPFTPAEKAAALARQKSKADYLEFLQLDLEDLERGYARMRLPFRRELTHSGGVVQGGLITTLADSCLAHAVIAALEGDTFSATTLELKVNFIRPGQGQWLVADAGLLHLGRRTAVGEAEVRNDAGKLVAKCLASLLIVAKGPAARHG